MSPPPGLQLAGGRWGFADGHSDLLFISFISLFFGGSVPPLYYDGLVGWIKAVWRLHLRCCHYAERWWIYSHTSCFLSQRLAESAEDADLYHDFNATMKVGALRYPPNWILKFILKSYPPSCCPPCLNLYFFYSTLQPAGLKPRWAEIIPRRFNWPKLSAVL